MSTKRILEIFMGWNAQDVFFWRSFSDLNSTFFCTFHKHGHVQQRNAPNYYTQTIFLVSFFLYSPRFAFLYPSYHVPLTPTLSPLLFFEISKRKNVTAHCRPRQLCGLSAQCPDTDTQWTTHVHSTFLWKVGRGTPTPSSCRHPNIRSCLCSLQ